MKHTLCINIKMRFGITLNGLSWLSCTSIILVYNTELVQDRFN